MIVQNGEQRTRGKELEPFKGEKVYKKYKQNELKNDQNSWMVGGCVCVPPMPTHFVVSANLG